MHSMKQLVSECAQVLRRRSFLNVYHQTFALVRADTGALKHEAYKLRYQVYSHGYDNAEEYDDLKQILKDEDDERAVHYLLIHRKTEEVVGTLRILFNHHDPEKPALPLQALCDHPLLHIPARTQKLCEISRFCMTEKYRSRESDGRFLAAYHDQDALENKKSFVRSIPYPQAALLQGAFETALSRQIPECVMLVEPGHLPSLNKIGMAYRTLGPQIGPYGGIQPVIFSIKNTLDSMRSQAPFCWEIISDNGRLQHMADLLSQNIWQDGLLDQQCHEMIYARCLEENSAAQS